MGNAGSEHLCARCLPAQSKFRNSREVGRWAGSPHSVARDLLLLRRQRCSACQCSGWRGGGHEAVPIPCPSRGSRDTVSPGRRVLLALAWTGEFGDPVPPWVNCSLAGLLLGQLGLAYNQALRSLEQQSSKVRVSSPPWLRCRQPLQDCRTWLGKSPGWDGPGVS